jgi:hypothetical protein
MNMEYISAEEFLKQPKEVQKVIIDWWKSNESETDLVCLFLQDGNEIRLNSANIQKCNLRPITEIIPLLTEGQLRKCIEGMSHCNMLILWNTYYGDIYQHKVCFSKKSHFNKIDLKRCTNLLEAYWLAVLEIAKEKVKA